MSTRSLGGMASTLLGFGSGAGTGCPPSREWRFPDPDVMLPPGPMTTLPPPARYDAFCHTRHGTVHPNGLLAIAVFADGGDA